MGKYFGTDGVRGVANEGLTPELAYRLGRAGAYVLAKQVDRPRIVIGRDTRISGHMLEAALTAGILSIGADAIQLGVVPTPGVAYLTHYLGADAGVMISASHNPVADNGIKFFGRDGYKLLDETERDIEALLEEKTDTLPRPIGEHVGVLERQTDLIDAYATHLRRTVNHRFDGLKIVLDCANGAASAIAPDLFRALGADVVVIAGSPNGVNINVDCGSTHPEQLQRAVVHERADVGLAFDGDADRLIAVDHTGAILDGDYIMCILATYLKRHGRLNGDTLVTTVMSNIGLYKAAEAHAMKTVKTNVGDRYVMEAMREGGYNLGGEQSGHIILLDYATTGDGLLTAVQLVNVMQAEKKSLHALKQVMTKYPQVLENVTVKDKHGWKQNQAIQAVIQDVEAKLGSEGRVLVRASGTEPLIRVMAEGPDESLLRQYVDYIVQTIRNELE